jgi:hypothetical protein
MDIITIFKQKRKLHDTKSDINSVAVPSTRRVEKSTPSVRESAGVAVSNFPPIDDEPKRFFMEDDYKDIFQEVLRCEYLCRERHLGYNRKVYFGDQDLHKRKEFLLDYLYSLVACLEDSLQERIAIQSNLEGVGNEDEI